MLMRRVCGSIPREEQKSACAESSGAQQEKARIDHGESTQEWHEPCLMQQLSRARLGLAEPQLGSRLHQGASGLSMSCMKSSLAFLCTALALGLFAPSPLAAEDSQKIKDVTPEAAEKLLQEKKDVVILDIRTPEEFESGHIAGARNLDFFGKDFAKEVAALEKDKTYLVHCASGGRSTKALKHFEEQKLPSVFHLNGGFKAWEAAGKPVERK
jgi:rhodanese-related sulfurtransferase